MKNIALTVLTAMLTSSAFAADPWVVYKGAAGPGHGKHVVLISGDEEYRSEETLTQLGRILAKRHGFTCTALYAIDPKDGTINPNANNNIPGLEVLKRADLVVLFLRYRNLPDEQMKLIADYVESGKPIIGLRTSTHAFEGLKGKYEDWNDSHKEGGFGRRVLGEKWIDHHGAHGTQGTRGIVVKDRCTHPILCGVTDGDIFGPTDVYTVRLPLPNDCTALVLGEVTESLDPKSKAIVGKKNDPMMPIAWTNKYKSAKVFTCTIGASQDFASAGLRRLLVNACYWAVGLDDRITVDMNVDTVGEFKPLPFGNDKFKKGVRPADLAIE